LEHPVAPESKATEMRAPPLFVPLGACADLVDAPRECQQGGIARIQPIDLELCEVSDDQVRRGHPLAVAVIHGWQCTGNELHQCRLAGAVAPQDSDALPWVHR